MIWGKSPDTLCPRLPQVRGEGGDRTAGRRGLNELMDTMSWAHAGPIAGCWIHFPVKILVSDGSREGAPCSPLDRWEDRASKSCLSWDSAGIPRTAISDRALGRSLCRKLSFQARDSDKRTAEPSEPQSALLPSPHACEVAELLPLT